MEVITYCKGRLEHLKKTLPSIERVAKPIIVICQDHEALKWCTLNSSAKLVWTNRDYCQPHVRNCGLLWSESEYITFIDADRYYKHPETPDPGTYLHHCMKTEEHFGYTVGRAGNITVRRSDALKINGFDERMTDYGFDDTDFCIRLQMLGLQGRVCGKFKVLDHPDERRTENFANKNLKETWARNRSISEKTVKSGDPVFRGSIGNDSHLERP